MMSNTMQFKKTFKHKSKKQKKKKIGTNIVILKHAYL